MTTEPTVTPKPGETPAPADLENKDSKSQSGNPSPPPTPADAPKPEPTAEEKAAADAAAAEAKAKEEADKAATEADETPDDDTPLDTEVWGSTGNEVADSVMQILQNSGVTPDEAKTLLFDAVMEGDATKIDRDALVEKVGKAKTTLIMAGVNNFITDNAKRNDAILAEVHGAAGGEANWKQMAEWGKKNIPQETLNEYRTMIDAGGAQARFAASEIAKAYNADPNNTSIDTSGTGEVVGDAGPGKGGRAITKVEFANELNAAMRKGATEAQIQEIHAARHRGRAKGI